MTSSMGALTIDPSTSTALSVTVSLPNGRDTNALYPATHLQISYSYSPMSCQIFSPKVITSNDLIRCDSDPSLYSIEIPDSEVPRIKYPAAGDSHVAEVHVHAWKGEKNLGSWRLGQIERPALVGRNPLGNTVMV